MPASPARSIAPAILATAFIALASVVGLAAPANAATITVGSSGYATISDAVAAASPGDVIEVAAGTYTEDVSITIPVTLVGAGSATTIVVGTMTLSAPTDVSGFTLEAQTAVPGTTAPYAPTTLQISPGGAGSDIHDNVLANGYQDVYAQGVVGSAGLPTLIEDNTIRAFHADQGTGVWIANSAFFRVDGNTITDGTPLDGNSVGVNLMCGSSDIGIASNTISDVGNAVADIADGTCSASTGVTIEDNTLSDTAGSALYFGANNLGGITIAGNHIAHVGGTGAAVLISGYSGWLASPGVPISVFTVSSNSVSDAPNGFVVGAGVQLLDSSSVTSSDNKYCSSGLSLDNATTDGFTIASVDDDFCSTSAGPGVVVTGPEKSTPKSPGHAAASASPKSATAAKDVDPNGLLAVTGSSSTSTDSSTNSGSSEGSSSTTTHAKTLTPAQQRAAAGFPLWLGILLGVLIALIVIVVIYFMHGRRYA